jgi:hypothetical protein
MSFEIIITRHCWEFGFALECSKLALPHSFISCCFPFTIFKPNSKCFYNGGKSLAIILNWVKTGSMSSPRLEIM